MFRVDTVLFAAQVGKGDRWLFSGFRQWLSRGLSRRARHLCAVKPPISLGRGRMGLELTEFAHLLVMDGQHPSR